MDEIQQDFQSSLANVHDEERSGWLGIKTNEIVQVDQKIVEVDQLLMNLFLWEDSWIPRHRILQRPSCNVKKWAYKRTTIVWKYEVET